MQDAHTVAKVGHEAAIYSFEAGLDLSHVRFDRLGSVDEYNDAFDLTAQHSQQAMVVSVPAICTTNRGKSQ